MGEVKSRLDFVCANENNSIRLINLMMGLISCWIHTYADTAKNEHDKILHRKLPVSECFSVKSDFRSCNEKMMAKAEERWK